MSIFLAKALIEELYSLICDTLTCTYMFLSLHVLLLCSLNDGKNVRQASVTSRLDLKVTFYSTWDVLTVNILTLQCTVIHKNRVYLYLLFQYAFSVKEEGEVMISLMQEDTRKEKERGVENLTIGYFVMKVHVH